MARTKTTAEAEEVTARNAESAKTGKPKAIRVNAITRMNWPKEGQLSHYYGRMEIGDDGQPTDRWLARSLTTVRLPYSMRCAWNPETVIRKVRVHRQVGRSLTQVLSRVLEQLGLDGVRGAGVDLFCGTYALPDFHCLSARHFGAAIDFDVREMPEEVVSLFTAAGWTWGGEDRPGTFEAVA